jgi:hypothetical protein
MQEESTPTTLADALLWLNDRLVKNVAVSVAVEYGDQEVRS